MPSLSRNRYTLLVVVLFVALLLVSLQPAFAIPYDPADLDDFFDPSTDADELNPDAPGLFDLDEFDTIVNPRYNTISPTSTQGGGPSSALTKKPKWGPIDGVNVDMIDTKILGELKKAIKAGKVPKDKKAALDSLKQRADGLVSRQKVYSVTFSGVKPPNNSTHYYYSRLAYAWPMCPKGKKFKDPQTQCPWKIWDGHFYPGDKKITCLLQLTRLTRNTQTLSVAYFLYGNEAYAKLFTRIIKTWFLDKKTYMAPDMSYAQVVPQGYPWQWSGRRTGLLDTHNFITMLSGVEIIKASKNWDNKTNSDLQKWFKKYSVWFETSPMGRKEGEGVNNHGTYYKAQLAAFSRFVGDDAKVKKILQSYITPLFDMQFNASGAQPYELRRVFSTRYSFFNLQGVMYLAKLGQNYGIDLWKRKNKSGAGIQTAVDFLIPLALNPRDDESPAGLLPLLEDAENIYGGKKYVTAIKKIRELTNGGDSLAEWTLWK